MKQITASEAILDYLKKSNINHFANDNISKYVDERDLPEIEAEVAEAFEGVLKALIINIEDDHNTKDTACRVAKMYVQEIFKGRYIDPPKITAFPNAK